MDKEIALQDAISRIDVDFLLSLAPGDYVEAHSANGECVQGIVETTFVEQGMLWIYSHVGERKLLDVQEHRIQRSL